MVTDWEHQIRIARQRGTDEKTAHIGMEIAKPAPDFANLAQVFGWYAEGPIERPDEVRAAVARAARVVRKRSARRSSIPSRSSSNLSHERLPRSYSRPEALFRAGCVSGTPNSALARY